MGSVRRLRTAKTTLSLIEICRRELDRLQKTAAEYRIYCSKSRECLATAMEAYKPVDGNELPKSADAYGFIRMSPIPDTQTCRERAEENRVFAERVGDPQVKKLLLKIAAGYEKAANGKALG